MLCTQLKGEIGRGYRKAHVYHLHYFQARFVSRETPCLNWQGVSRFRVGNYHLYVTKNTSGSNFRDKAACLANFFHELPEVRVILQQKQFSLTSKLHQHLFNSGG